MIEQCRFKNGENSIQCNLVKGLLALREQTEKVFSVKELQEIMCGSTVNDDCPAFKSLKELGKRSDFAKPTGIFL